MKRDTFLFVAFVALLLAGCAARPPVDRGARTISEYCENARDAAFVAFRSKLGGASRDDTLRLLHETYADVSMRPLEARTFENVTGIVYDVQFTNRITAGEITYATCVLMMQQDAWFR